jgi:hypothetical protein
MFVLADCAYLRARGRGQTSGVLVVFSGSPIAMAQWRTQPGSESG